MREAGGTRPKSENQAAGALFRLTERGKTGFGLGVFGLEGVHWG
jgi:hypothetical protein